jgi:proteasome assembly chaperone (PAC2) family protein
MTAATLPAILPNQAHDLIRFARNHIEMAQRCAERGMSTRVIRSHQATARESIIGAAGILVGLGIVDGLAAGVTMIEQATGLTTPHR